MITDSSVTDSDVFTASVGSYSNTLLPTIVNVENININGDFASSGLALTNVVGATNLNLNTGIIGGTATVIDIAGTKAKNITSGANVGTLNVTALTAGTGGNVTVDATRADTVSVVSGAASDTFTVNTKANAAITLNGAAGSGDTFTLNANGGGSRLTVDAGLIETLNINSNTAANTITLGATTALAGVATGNKVVLGGSQALTIAGDGDAIGSAAVGTNVAIEEAAGAGVTTYNMTALTTVTNLFFNRAAVDVIRFSFDPGAARVFTVNQNSTVLYGSATGTGALTFNIDNSAGNLASGANTGNLKLDTGTTARTHFGLTTGAQVATATLAVGANTTITTLDSSAAAFETLSVSGSGNLTLTTWTNGAGDVLSASGLTGRLTVGTTAAQPMIIIGGSAGDSITTGAFAATGTVIRGGGGDDTINAALGTTASGAAIFGDDGADVITGTLTKDTVTGGAGADRMVMALATNTTFSNAAANVDYFTDFAAGTDKIVLAAGNTTAAAVLRNISTTSATNQALIDATADVFAAAANVATNLAAYSGSTYTAAANDVLVFIYKGETYAYLNVDTTAAVAATDAMVRLTGLTGTLSAADFLIS